MDLVSQKCIFTIAQPNKQCSAFDCVVCLLMRPYWCSHWKEEGLRDFPVKRFNFANLTCIWMDVGGGMFSISLSLCLSVPMYTPVCSQCAEWSAGAHLCQWTALLFIPHALPGALSLTFSLSLSRSLSLSLILCDHALTFDIPLSIFHLPPFLLFSNVLGLYSNVLVQCTCT